MQINFMCKWSSLFSDSVRNEDHKSFMTLKQKKHNKAYLSGASVPYLQI